LYQAFDAADIDNTGSLDAFELAAVMKKLSKNTALTFEHSASDKALGKPHFKGTWVSNIQAGPTVTLTKPPSYGRHSNKAFIQEFIPNLMIYFVTGGYQIFRCG